MIILALVAFFIPINCLVVLLTFITDSSIDWVGYLMNLLTNCNSCRSSTSTLCFLTRFNSKFVLYHVHYALWDSFSRCIFTYIYTQFICNLMFTFMWSSSSVIYQIYISRILHTVFTVVFQWPMMLSAPFNRCLTKHVKPSVKDSNYLSCVVPVWWEILTFHRLTALHNKCIHTH